MRLYLVNPSLVSFVNVSEKPLEPLPPVEAAQPDGARGPDAARMKISIVDEILTCGKGGPEAPKPATPRRTLNRNRESHFLTTESEL